MSALHTNRRGAAMVELLVILVPLMTLFLSMLELTRLAIAHLLLERAAGMAVRACAVMKDQPKNCEWDPDADALIQRAATEAIRPWTEASLALDSVQCQTKKPSGEDSVQVRAQFRCIVPIARDILCNAEQGAPSRAVTARASYAHQGANYDCNYASMEYALPGATGPIDLPALGGAWP